MSAMPSIAGPSHLPYSHIIRLSRHFRSRGYATPPSTADDSAQDPPLPFPLDTDTPPAPREEEMDRDARALALREKKLWASGRGFAQWKRLFGNPYAYHTKGDRAKWLGGGVPFPANPTFRPPPPLSNDMQDKLYRDLTAGQKTVGALANDYSVSKARIEAVRKLKEVEAEMKRQSLPLQQAFLEGMEPLLAVQTTVDPRTRQYSERIQREAAQTRRSHPSTSAEKEEEQRWESGVGLGGAFGNRVKQGNTKGIERSAWEWRGEDAVLKATAAMETAREQAKEAAGKAARNSQTKAEGNVAVKEMPAAEEAFPTPLTEVLKPADAISHRPSAASLPSKSVDASSEKSTLYRFVDTSTRGIVQPKDVQKAIQDREKSMAKRAKRRAARV